MITNVWVKTILSAYPYLFKLADAIDRVVERRALNSFYVTSSNFASNNVYDIANQLIDLSERKVNLINLKVLIENALKKCDKKNAKILILKYISRKKSLESSQMLSISLRTYFRRLPIAEKQFEIAIKKLGFDAGKLEEYSREEQWILDIKKHFEGNDSEDVVLDLQFPKVAY